MKCSYCNTDLKQGAKFCPKCGREVVVNDVCINCGKPIKLGASFCPYCGANQHPQQFVQAQEDDKTQSNVEVVPSETDETAPKIEQESRSVNATEIQSEEEQEAPPSDVVNASSKEEQKEEQEAKPINTAETPLVEKQESKDSEDPTPEEQDVKLSKVVDDQSESDQLESALIEEPKKNSNFIKIAISIVAVVLLLGGAFCFWHSSTQEADSAVVKIDSTTPIVEEPNDVKNSTTDNEVNEAEPPTIQELEMMFDLLTKGECGKITGYGFKFVNKESRREESEYEGGEDYTIFKEIYEKHYKMIDSNNDIHNLADGFMIINCVYSPDHGDPSMTIKCDEVTWNYMKNSASNTMKEFGDNTYFLTTGNFIGFANTNEITITSEASVSW